MKKAVVIFNPTAGFLSKKDLKSEVEQKLKEIDINPDFLILDSNFETIADNYNWSGVELIIAWGGDGTVKVAARTIMQFKLNIPLAIIPFGSANVLASTLKIPFNINEAIKLIAKGRISNIDIGRINKEKYFLVGFSVGYVSSIIINTEKELKNKFGFWGYAIRLFWNKVRITRIKFKIETQNRIFWLRGNSLIVFNAFNFYGFQAKKNISINDGLLNLYVVTNKTFFSMIEAALGVLFYDNPPKHIFTLDNKEFKITLKHRRHLKTCQIDGDYIKLDKEIVIDVLPSALQVIS
mgnify:CR=1 FL=1